MGASSFIFASDVVPIFYGKRAWPGCPSKKQDWGYPESMINYIAKNPSSAKVYRKMIRSCKHFFEKNPVLVVSKLVEDNVKCYICLNKANKCEKNKGKCCVKIDIAKLSSKIWLRDELDIADGAKHFTSVLCAKLYRYEISRLQMWKKITFNDGKPVMLDRIIESSPIVTRFIFNDNNDVSMVNFSTMKNIMALKNLGKIEFFGLYNLPESFSIEDISSFFKKYEHVKIQFCFNKNISEDYKDQLDALIDEINESGPVNRIIRYDGQNEVNLQF